MKQLIGIPVACAILAFAGLYWTTGNPLFVWQAFTLAVIEVSVSFDNAVVNAEKLHDMSAFWRQVFIWIGIPIAVFGMRFAVPLFIVSTIEGSTLSAAYDMAIAAPDKFAESLHAAHPAIAGFGGAFLLLTALEFFIDPEKEQHWLPGERWLQNAHVVKGLEYGALFVATLITYRVTDNLAMVVASLAGALTFICMNAIKHSMESLDHMMAASTSKLAQILKGGLGGFLYLEVLDASFSLDGVVAAFAISKHIWIVAVGLGIGAVVIRELTIWMVKNSVTKSLVYLPHGAFWSILALAISMFVSVVHELPDWAIAVVSVSFISAAIFKSLRYNQAQAQAQAQTA